MSALSHIWKDRRLPLTTKTRIHQALVLSVLLYTAETWTLLDADSRALEAFHMKCQKQLLQIKWHQFIRNDDIIESTCLPSISESISRRRNSSITSPGCKRTFQLIRHSNATSTYHSDVHQVANGVVVQAVLATDGLTRFGGTTTSRPLTSGGVPSILVTAGRRYSLYRLRINNDDDEFSKTGYLVTAEDDTVTF